MLGIDLRRVIFLAFAFCVAMGFLEAAVVIYLRELYYPTGFRFPLSPISLISGQTELAREIATLIMLLTFSAIAGKDNIRRFAFFIFSFAIWDLVYYASLKIILDWPESIMDWDILFLLPVPWFGPVLAPCIISILMIIFSFILFNSPAIPLIKLIKPYNWMLLIIGSITIIFTFIIDYLNFTLLLLQDSKENGDSKLLLSELSGYIPHHFLWWLFGLGIILISVAMVVIYKKSILFKSN